MEIRQPTTEEITGDVTSETSRAFIPLSVPRGKITSPQDKFAAKISEEQQKAIKIGLPFAEAAVRADLKDIQDKALKSWSRQGYVESDYKFPQINWDKYSNLKNFDVLQEDTKHDEYLSKIHRLPVFVKFKKYQYKGFSNTYTVMEPQESAVQRAYESVEQRKVNK